MSDSNNYSQTDLTPKFTHSDVEIVSTDTVFQGFFTMRRLRLRHRLYRGGWGREMERELFVRGAAVGVLLYDPDRQLVALTEQFRIGALERSTGPWCLEVVAGMVEQSESLQDVARRELREEAGLEVTELHYIRSYMPSPGGSSERMHLFCAMADLRNAEGYFGLHDEHEDICLRIFPAQALFDALEKDSGDECPIDNAATLISIQWLQLNRQRLAAEGRETTAG